MAGPKPDETCFCGKHQFQELQQGTPYANVYVDDDETNQLPPPEGAV